MIREAIRAELSRRKWTPYRLAKAAGVSLDPIYKYLAEERECTTATLEPVLKALGLGLRRNR